MDGIYNGKPDCLMDDLGGFPPLFSETSKYRPRLLGGYSSGFISHLLKGHLEDENHPDP